MAKDDSSKMSVIPIASMLKRGDFIILVVEDDKFLRELLIGKLKREGYKTLEAIDGEAGMRVARETTPHLIVLDLVLPGADGFEVLEMLKKDGKTAKIPVIILSNLGSREDIDRTLALGAKEFMVKAHHTPQEIVHTINKVLDDAYIKK